MKKNWTSTRTFNSAASFFLSLLNLCLSCSAAFLASLRLLFISYSCKLGITLLFASDKAGHTFAYRSGGARCSTEIKKQTINQGKQTDG